MLEAELSPLLSPGLRALMFNKGADFKKHCQGAEMIVEALPALFGEVGDDVVSLRAHIASRVSISDRSTSYPP